MKKKASQKPEQHVVPEEDVVKDEEPASIPQKQPTEDPNAQAKRSARMEMQHADSPESAVVATSFDRDTAKLAKAKVKFRILHKLRREARAYVASASKEVKDA